MMTQRTDPSPEDARHGWHKPHGPAAAHGEMKTAAHPGVSGASAADPAADAVAARAAGLDPAADVRIAPAAGPAEGVAAAPSPREALLEAEDRYLRLRAEFDNYRRRASREREQAVETGVELLALPLLEVLDNLERALAHSDGAPGPWRDGVEMTLRQFLEALKGVGVVPVEPLGEPFDPRFHEALTTQPSGDVPADYVMMVVSRGYRLGDRVLRPARVVVSSGS